MARLTNFLVCYDIREPKRLQRVHKCAASYAMAVQRSVFYARLTQADLDSLMKDLVELIDEKEDDVRIYSVAPLQHAVMLGTNRTGYVGDSWMMYFGEKTEKNE